ncbi:MAG: ComEC/Rec2 family competence protein [Patescibacteria group bacterium]|jgi:competence protein ComEC
MKLRDRLNLICFLCLGFIGGCVVAEFVPAGLPLFWLGLGLLVSLVLSWPNQRVRIGIIGVIGLIGGIGLWQTNFNRWNVNLPTGSAMQITGHLATPLNDGLYNKQAVLTVTNIPSHPQILAYFPQSATLNYGDEVKFSGKLSEITATSKFDGARYWRVRGAKYQTTITQFQTTSTNRGNPLTHYLYQFKDYIKSRNQIALPNNESGLLFGLLFGGSGLLPKAITDQFRTLGISHLTAVSGYNLTIISLWPIVLAGLVHKKWAIGFSAALVLLFVIFTGAPSSIVRAAVMAWVMLLGKLIGRAPHSLLLICSVATIMAIINPFAVKDDAGFILSFLAFFGLVEIGPMLYPKTKWLRLDSLRLIFSQTVGAQIATLPYLLGAFGQLTIISPLSNLVILPLIPLMMLVGLAGVILMAIPLKITLITSSILYYPLHGFLWVIALGSQIPYASFTWQKGGLFPWYLAILIFIWWSLSKRQMFRKSVGAVHEPPAGNSC